jgi:hypothetical protein
LLSFVGFLQLRELAERNPRLPRGLNGFATSLEVKVPAVTLTGTAYLHWMTTYALKHDANVVLEKLGR